MSNFQNKLTEEISNGSNLQTIANIVYDITQIPILIEDIDFRTDYICGFIEEKPILELKEDLNQYIRGKKEKHLLPSRKKTIKTTNQERLITPNSCPKGDFGILFIYL